MSIVSKRIVDKHCFVQCPPERCDCKAGNRMAWIFQQAQLGLDENGNPLKTAEFKTGISSPSVKAK